MKKLLVATTNPGKLKEISNFLSDLPLKIISLSGIGITDRVEEVGKNYEENSQLKALFYSKKSGLPTIADDGGIEISALDGAPGVNSKRWLGKVWSVSGEVEGIIARKPYLKLLKGYPYRSFFYLPKIKKYYHEDQLDAEEEKEYNHRYKAIQKLIPIISQELIS